jgi:hypothetical protein
MDRTGDEALGALLMGIRICTDERTAFLTRSDHQRHKLDRSHAGGISHQRSAPQARATVPWGHRRAPQASIQAEPCDHFTSHRH